MLPAHLENCPHRVIGQSAGMAVRPAALRGNHVPPAVHSFLDPPDDGRVAVPQMSCDLADAPALPDQFDGLHADVGKAGMGGVGHSTTVGRGGAKLLNHYAVIDF